ncbi:hypothetical protein ACG9YX_06135 [Acinetobacter nematophilus]|uniref:hypothetical protein n=1 Tax=Acinetobacter nematophilus TaxID=2994642 RepID=UPI003AF85F3D
MISDLSLAPMEFILKRLVFINSAKHAYSELLLDQHLAMFGRNNNGKTASLAATKLLLFPESNFKHCYSKFGFEGKDGPYDSEQSFRFYFPIAQSFIALEVQNPTHTFTMVLYRASNNDKNQAYSYHRAFIPVAYSALRHLFWDEVTEDFAENLNLAALIKFTKANGGEIVTDTTRLRQLMFARLGSADAQYCIVPLKDNNKDSVTAFNRIYNLAFAMSNKVSDVLPIAIASLIEMQRGRDEEKLDTSLEETYQSFLKLQDQGREIQLKENKKLIFETLFNEFKTLQQDARTYSIQSYQLQQYARHRMQSLTPEKEKCRQTIIELKEKLKSLSTEIIGFVRQKNEAEATVKTRERDKKNYYIEIQRAKTIILDYPSHLSHDEIIESIKEDSRQKQVELTLIQDAAKRETELQTKTRLRDEAKGKIEHLIAEIERLKSENDNSLLVKQLNDHNTQVLHSLNPSLLTVSHILSDNDRQIIDDFTHLFGIEMPTLRFKNTQTKIAYREYRPEQMVQQLENELQQYENSYQDYLIDVNKLHDLIRSLGDQEISRQNEYKLKNAIKKNDTDIQLLQALATHQKNFEVAESEIQENQKRVESYQEMINIKGIAEETLKNHAENENSIYESLSDQALKCDEILEQTRLATGFYVLQDKKGFSEEELMLVKSITVDNAKNQATGLVGIAGNISNKHSRFHQRFTNFMRDIQLENLNPDFESYRLEEFAVYVDAYQMMFNNLAFEQRQLSNAVRGHNEAIRAQVNEIKESRKQLNRAVNTINQKLNQYQISNLSGIRLHLETIEEFDALDRALEHHVLSGDTLPEEDFYKSLMEFFNKHQVKGRLKMAQLIKSINYRYKIDDIEVTKSQSGGTTTTITSFVLSVLLNEIKVADSLVRMPIIVDEISALDAENAASTIKQIGEYGFSIFCATPEFTGYLVSEVGRYIYINQHRAKNYIDAECQWNIMPHHMNYWGEHETQS